MDKPQMVEVAVIRPWDKVLLAVSDQDADRLAGMGEQLRELFPDVQFVFVACSGIAVQHDEVTA